MAQPAASIRLDGLKQFEAATKHLADSAKRRVARDAVRSAASVLNKQAKALTNKSRFDYGTGTLQKSIGVKMLTGRATRIYGAVAVVGPRTGRGRMVTRPGRSKPSFADAAKYGHLVHGGVNPHALGKGSVRVAGRTRKNPQGTGTGLQTGATHPGHAPYPFLLYAVAQSRSAMAAKIIESTRKGVIREAERAWKRAQKARAGG